MLIAELSRARSARTGAPWVRQLAFQASARFGVKGEKLDNNKAESFFPLNFNVYNELSNRERARERDKKQRRSISLEEKHENLKAAVRK